MAVQWSRIALSLFQVISLNYKKILLKWLTIQIIQNEGLPKHLIIHIGHNPWFIWQFKRKSGRANRQKYYRLWYRNFWANTIFQVNSQIYWLYFFLVCLSDYNFSFLRMQRIKYILVVDLIRFMWISSIQANSSNYL